MEMEKEIFSESIARIQYLNKPNYVSAHPTNNA
jgi:hypothetical protein